MRTSQVTSDRSLSPESPKELSRSVRLFSMALATGAPVSAEMMQWYTQSLEQLKDENDDLEPPQTPRRPNTPVRLGGLVLGNT